MKCIKNLIEKIENEKIIEISTDEQLEKICERSSVDYSENSKTMKIVNEIEKNISGLSPQKADEYISQLTEKFDGVQMKNFRVSSDEFLEAEKIISQSTESKAFIKAINVAYENISTFHQLQKKENIQKITTSAGVKCWQEFRAIEKVGLYIPAGTAPLFSTVLMLAIPAQIAGCRKKILCTPPNNEGKVAPEILYVAQKCGIDEIYKIGGAQAIFTMAYGTQQVPKVDKIFGPGNSFVTAAKMKISSFSAIDMPAGPSEVLVIADENANEIFIAADLLSQAEHGTDSQSVLVCSSVAKAKKVFEEISLQLETLPRKDIAKKSLENSFCIIAKNTDEMIKISNIYAPEHLILQVENWETIVSQITNAGSVFCGKYSCESLGDYATGTNHTLPTSGFAKNYSGVNLMSFGKMITFQEVSKKGIDELGELVEIMAKREALDGHANAVKVRRENI